MIKKSIYLTLILTAPALAEFPEQKTLSPFSTENPFQKNEQRSDENLFNPERSDSFDNSNRPFDEHNRTERRFEPASFDTKRTFESHELPEKKEHFSGDILNEDTFEKSFAHEATPTSPFTIEEGNGKPIERLSTASFTAKLPLIHVTAGHSYYDLPEIRNTRLNVTGYFIQDAECKEYLTHTTLEEGDITVLKYTLTIPKYVSSTVTTTPFTIFKGQGSLIAPRDLEPAFRVQIEGLPNHPEKPSSKNILKQAWDKQQVAEQKYLNDMNARFKAFTQEIRTIWSTVNKATDNFENDPFKQIVSKIVTQDPLHITVGQVQNIATSAGGSIQSSNPEAVSVKLSYAGNGESVSWNFFITGLTAGSSVVTYSMNGTTYKQPVIVQQKLEPTHTPDADTKVLTVDKNEVTIHEKKATIFQPSFPPKELMEDSFGSYELHKTSGPKTESNAFQDTDMLESHEPLKGNTDTVHEKDLA